MANQEYLSAVDRMYGLSLIWREAKYNFAFFYRVPDLDWDYAYREYIPQVIAAEDLLTYYDLLSRFTALLKDGHTLVLSPKSLHLSLDRPKLALMNVENVPIVTNASLDLSESVPIGSALLEIGGIDSREYLLKRTVPAVCETTPHRLLDHATARLLLGSQGSQVECKFHTPDGSTIEMELVRNRRMDPSPWLRTAQVPGPWEFRFFDEWFYDEAPYPSFIFRKLDGNVCYIALNSFMDQTVPALFTEKLPVIRHSSGLILDLRKNHGGSDDVGYSIAAHFLRQTTETIPVRSPQNIAFYRASGVSLKDTPPEKIADLSERAREQLLCFQNQWYYEEHWGPIQPAPEIFSLPTVLLTDSETGSAAEDFIMAFESGKSLATRIGSGTAGSTGQPLIQDLPGGGGFAICTIRMPWPEAVWQKGIEPNIYVEPTIEDVIKNEDRALETAVSYLCGDKVRK
jgi:carboxyl-terminal processing protease